MENRQFETLLFSVLEGVATVTLHRPSVYNAFNEAMTSELQEVLAYIAENDELRCMVITGAGKAFSSGQDLKESSAITEKRDFTDSLRRRYNPIVRAMRSMPKPIIAGINGVAAGAGLSIALAADIRIMSSAARLVEAFIGIALVPDSGATYFYPRMLGYSRAFEFATLNEPIDAENALRLGLVNQVVSPEVLPDALLAMAHKYAAAPTATIGMVKYLLQEGSVASLEQMLLLEEEYQQKAGESYDHREGVAAFTEKRAPEFLGK